MTLRYDVKIGTHAATVVLTGGEGPFTGVIESAEFGTGAIQGTVTKGVIKAAVDMDGHHADLTGNLDGTKIVGNLRCGWFYSEDFAGELVT